MSKRQEANKRFTDPNEDKANDTEVQAKEEVVESKGSDNPKTYMATLITGRVYFFKNRQFLRGVPRAVTAEEKEYLEESHQVKQTVTMNGETNITWHCGFKFDAVKAGEEGKVQDSDKKASQKPTTAARRKAGTKKNA